LQLPKFPPEIPETPLFEESRFFGPFRQKRLLFQRLQLAFLSGSVMTTVRIIPSKRKVLANGICGNFPERFFLEKTDLETSRKNSYQFNGMDLTGETNSLSNSQYNSVAQWARQEAAVAAVASVFFVKKKLDGKAFSA
jgi:hypothetical protein